MSIKARDLVLLVFTHQWDEMTDDDYESEDILDISIVHRPRTISRADGRWVGQVIQRSDCGTEIPLSSGTVIAPRKYLNTRNVRMCQRASCFGGKK